MPGFPLAAIGAGIGQFAQQYRQQQEQAMRQQLQQLAVDQSRKQQMARELEGLALSSGGIPGIGPGTGGINPVGTPIGGGGLPGAPAMPTPQTSAPAPVAAPSRWQEPGSAAAATGAATVTDTGGYGLGGAPAGSFNPDEPSQDEISRDPGAQSQMATPAPSDAPAAPAPIEPSGETKDGRLIFNVPGMGHMDLSSLFRQVDPQAIAAKIKELRPNAPPDAIAMATENLYKLANSGSKSQQLETMALLRYMQATRQQDLTHGDRVAGMGSREGIAAAGREAAGQRQQTGLDAAAGRQQTGIAAAGARQQTGLDAAAGRQQNSIAMRRQALEQAKGIADKSQKRQALSRLLADIDTNLGQLRLQGGHEAEIEELNKQRREIVNEARKDAGALALPPPPATALPGGGVSQPLR